MRVPGTVFGNISLINEISDHYADYKTEKTTKGQYDARRKKALDQLTENIGPMGKLLFGNHTPHNVIRIARAGGIPATAHITQQADRLKHLGSMSKHGGIVFAGVGLTAACMQIASITDTKEKNEIFVETITRRVGCVARTMRCGGIVLSALISWLR